MRGGKLIAVGRIPTRDPEGNSSPEITELSKAIMLVPNTAELEKALDNIGDPDVKLTSSDDHTKEVVGFIRRKLPTADIYFVANTSNQTVQATANFDTTQRDGEQWDPETGKAVHVTASNLPFNLAPYESRVFIFAHYSESEPPHRSLSDSASMTPLSDLSTDWSVAFTGTKENETEPTLTDWTTNPATLYYSGEAVYARDFTLPAKTGPVYLEIEGGKPLPGAPNSPPEHPPSAPTASPTHASLAPAPACTPTSTHPSTKPPSSSSTANGPALSGTHPTASTSPNS